MNIDVLINVGIVIIIVILGYILITYNRLVKLNNGVKKSKSDIDTHLKQRFDLIPNIVETVKGYAKHEKSTLNELTSLRSNVNNMSDVEKEDLNGKINKIMAIGEAYPDLKANTQFTSLQENLNQIENKLQHARTIYNSYVTSYNNLVETFPSELIAKLFSFYKMDLFKLDEEEQKNININF